VHDKEDSLARDARLLRALARSLVRRDDDADDVAQEAFLASLGRAPRKRGFSCRAWLAGIARNVARRTRRATARRDRHEAAAAAARRSSEVASPIEIADRLETLRSVVEAVEALSSPYRDALFLRYFESLSGAEIALRLGVSEATVRTRLNRGLVLVRERLDRAHGGDRRAWSLALLSIEVPSSPAAAATGVLIAMTLQTKLLFLAAAGAAGAVVMIAASIVATKDHGGRGEIPDTSRRGESALSAPLPATDGRQASAANPGSARAEPEAPALLVRGVALGPGGERLARVAVRASLHPGFRADAAPAGEARLVSGADGAFEWRGELPAGQSVTIVLRGDESRYVSFASTRLVLRGEDPGGPLEVRFWPRDCRVTGRVVDPDGEPVTRARVGALGLAEAAPCGADGSYAIAIASRFPQLTASADGFADATGTIGGATSSAEARLDFVLRPGISLRGRVVGPDGEPLAGARVTAPVEPGARRVETDASGRFEIGSLEPGLSEYSLAAAHDDYVRAAIRVPASEVERPQVVALARGTRLEVVVRDSLDRPVPGAAVVVASERRVPEAQGLSDDGGAFSSPALAEGSHVVVAERAGIGSAVRTVEIPGIATEAIEVFLRLDAGHSLDGLVVDRHGSPVAGAELRFRLARPITGFGPYLKLSAATGEDGRFEVSGLPRDEPIVLAIGADGFERLETVRPPGDAVGEVFVLSRAGAIAGRVIDGASGLPVERFRIRLMPPKLEPDDREGHGHDVSWTREGRTFTSSEGRFEIGEPLVAGAVYAVEASAHGYSPGVVERVVAVERPERDAIHLRLVPESSVKGRVLDEDGDAPVLGAAVWVFTRDRPLTEDDRAGNRRPVSVTNERGEFAIAGLEAGPASLAIEHDAFGLAVDGPFDLLPGASAPERIVRLRRGPRVAGVALDENGAPIAGASVFLSAADLAGGAEFRRETAADAAGRFDFGRVPPGEYRLGYDMLFAAQEDPSRYPRGIVQYWRRIDATTQGDIDARLEPDDGTASLSGVVDCGRDRPDSLLVRISPAFGSGSDWAARPGRTLVVRNDRFVAQRLHDGDVVVSVYEPGGRRRGESRVVLASGRAETVVIVLREE